MHWHPGQLRILQIRRPFNSDLHLTKLLSVILERRCCEEGNGYTHLGIFMESAVEGNHGRRGCVIPCSILLHIVLVQPAVHEVVNVSARGGGCMSTLNVKVLKTNTSDLHAAVWLVIQGNRWDILRWVVQYACLLGIGSRKHLQK